MIDLSRAHAAGRGKGFRKVRAGALFPSECRWLDLDDVKPSDMDRSYLISDIASLTALYRTPTTSVQNKVRATLDDGSAKFIARSPFFTLATSGADGSVDVSPRGGKPGFVKLLDDKHLAIPDLNGNNRIDSHRNIVSSGQVGALFMVPGKDETLRVNGTAVLTTDPKILGRFDYEKQAIALAIVVEVREVFVHCAKAFRRGQVWDPSSWGALATAPDLIEIQASQGLLSQDARTARLELDAIYESELASE